MSSAGETRAKDKNELGTLHRGLDALETLNRHSALTARELSQRLGMSRTSARRILDTLVSAGYVYKIPDGLHYRLAPRVADLASGLSDGHVLSYAAAPLLYALTAQTGWTYSLVTLSGPNIVLQISTAKQAVHATTYFAYGETRPLQQTPVGKLLMAYLPMEARDAVFAHIGHLEGPDAERSARTLFSPEDEAATIRADGYYAPPDLQVRQAHLFVPVIIGDRAPGSLIMRYLPTAVPRQTLIPNHLPALQQIAHQIAQTAGPALRVVGLTR